MEKQWKWMDKVVREYPELFSPEKVNRDLFFYCYEICMTRGYGWTLPSVCLVPLADMFNHHCDSTTHYMINTRFEGHVEQAHAKYNIKKHKIDLELFQDKSLSFSQEDIQANRLFL
jgi:hypothetical protein